MMEDEFSVITYNVKGLQTSKEKRIKIFNYLKEKAPRGIFLLQETHSSNSVTQKWSKEWGSPIKYNHGTSNSRGTLIAFSKNLDYKILNYLDDGIGRLQICSVQMKETKYLIINVYNNNIETEQVKTLKNLTSMLETVNNIHEHELILGGDWNTIFDRILDASGGNPSLKLNTLAEISKLVSTFDLCDIYRMRHPHQKRFTFRQPTPRKLRRLDFFLTSKSLQDRISKIETITSVHSDHSPVVLEIDLVRPFSPGPSFWKFNASLVRETNFCQQISSIIDEIKTGHQDLSHQAKWEFLKYKIRNFCMAFSKKIAKEKRKRLEIAEEIIKKHENTVDAVSEAIYNEAKTDFETILENKTKGYILRSKTQD